MPPVNGSWDCVFGTIKDGRFFFGSETLVSTVTATSVLSIFPKFMLMTNCRRRNENPLCPNVEKDPLESRLNGDLI